MSADSSVADSYGLDIGKEYTAEEITTALIERSQAPPDFDLNY